MTKPETTVGDAIYNELEPETVHAINVTKETDSTTYMVVVSERPVGDVSDVDGDWIVIDQRTVVYDHDTSEVVVTDNGMWTPATKSNLGNLCSSLARSQSAAGGNDSDEKMLKQSAVNSTDAGVVLTQPAGSGGGGGGRDVDRMRREPGIDPSREWGYGGGPPEAAHDVADALDAVGLDPSDHLIRCKFGKKEPHGAERKGRPVDDLAGNYGIEPNKQQSGLVNIDVDYPDELPDEIADQLPETMRVSSPHGDDERCHRLYYCENKQQVAEHVGSTDTPTWMVQGLPWGDLWIGEPYLVGAGSQLSAYGCDSNGHDVGDEGACSVCSDPNGGYYELVNDPEIAEIESDLLIDLLDATDDDPNDVTDDDRPDDTEQETADRPDEIDGDAVKCDNCGNWVAEDEVTVVEVAGREVATCSGGCGS